MEYINVIRRKLISLAEYSKELSPFKDYSFDQYVGNYFIKRTGERLIQLIVENMVDINSVVISQKNLPPPKDYYSSFEILGTIDVLPTDFSLALAPCTGMRNRLVYEYDRIDDRLVFNGISKLIEMVNVYIKHINHFIKGID